MKYAIPKNIHVLIGFCLFALSKLSLQAQPTYEQTYSDSVILFDEFHDRSLFDDLTTKQLWGTYTDTTTGFKLAAYTDSSGLTYQALSLTDAAIQYAGYRPGTTRASQAIDYIFPQTIFRDSSTLVIEFDALWEVFNNNSWGESGRLVFTLLHNYPKNGIPMGAIDDITADAPYGRPCYNLRIRNNDLTGQYYSNGFMLYGGGHVKEGEIEKTDDYWMPGFSSEPGGTPPGLGDPYPKSPTQKNEQFVIVSKQDWMHYTWQIAPERMSLFVRQSGTAVEEDSLVFFMEIPRMNQPEDSIIQQINGAHGSNITQLPALYHWFDSLEALRVFYRAEEQTYLANLKIKHQYPVYTITALKSVQAFESETTLFPNPSKNYLNVSLPEQLVGSEFRIWDMKGRIVAEGSCNHQIQRIDLPSSQFSKGLYFLQIVHGKSRIVKKIVLE